MLLRFITVASVIVIVGGSYISAQNRLYAQGIAAFDAHEWGAAAKLMNDVEQAVPGQTDALIFAAKAYTNLNRLAEADNCLQRYVSYHPDAAEGLYLLGVIEERENKPRESLSTFTRAAKLQTPSAEQLRIVGLNYVLLDDYPDAIHWLEKAVQLDSRNSKAWYALGRSYYTQSRFHDAELAFKKAIQLDSSDMKAMENLGLVYDAENKIDDADASFQAAISLANKAQQTDEWPYLDYGDFLLNRNQAQQAILQLEHAVAINPGCVACHEKLGRALEATGLVKEALPHLERAVALSEEDPRLHYELGLAYRKAGFKERAAEELSLSRKLYGTKTPVSQN